MKFSDFINKQKHTVDKVKLVAAKTIANQVNDLLGLKDVGDNMKKGYVGIPAEDPRKGMVGVVLFRLVKENGDPLTPEEQKDGNVIDGDTRESVLHFQYPATEPCTKEVVCSDKSVMEKAYDEAWLKHWLIDSDDDPDKREFGIIITNRRERVRYSIPYRLLTDRKEG